MRLPWITTCFLLGLIIVLDPTPTPAQFGRKGDGPRGEFGRKGDFGGKRREFNGFPTRGNVAPDGPAPAMAAPADKPVILYGAGGVPADGNKPAFMLSTSAGPAAYQMPPSNGFGGTRSFNGGGPSSGFGGPGSGFGGPGGGFDPSSGRGRGFDPSSMWDRISRGRDSINLNDPENSRTRSMMERFGTPIPANGILTKEAYLAEAQKRMGAMSGSSPGGPTMVSLSGSTSPDGRMALTPGFGGDRGNFNPGGFGGDRERGNDRDRDRDRGAERLREQDRDSDGRVSRAEADRQLQPNFERIDRDNDGFITLDEYRGYYAAQNNDRDRNRDMGAWGGGGWGGGIGGDMAGWGNRQDSRGQAEEPRPVAVRYGHLPKDLPEWFDEYDATRDGQVALHEWLKGAKAAGESATVEAFSVYDLNGDQLITSEEVLRYGRLQADAKRIAAIQDGNGSTRPSLAGSSGSRMRGPGGSMSGFQRPGSKSDADVSTERGSGKRDSDKRSESSDKPEKSDKSEQSPGSNGRWGNGGKKVKG